MAANALKKITAEAKRIRKRHPGKSWKGAVKEAGRKYRSGTIAGPRKSHPKKHKRRHRPKAKPRKRKSAIRTVVVVSGTHTKRRRKRSRARYKVTHRVKRVGSTGSGGMKTKDLLLAGGLIVGALVIYNAVRKQNTTTPVQGAPPLTLTSNPTRNTQASEIIAWATAGGLALNAIANLISSLNNKSDAQVSAIHDNIATQGSVPDWAFIA